MICGDLSVLRKEHLSWYSSKEEQRKENEDQSGRGDFDDLDLHR